MLRAVPDPEPRNNLPARVSSFIGREAELAEVRALVGESRLVTLSGAGGAGKTRLGLQAAAGLADETGDEVWFADLAPLGDPDLVAVTVADVLDVRQEPGRPVADTLVEAVGRRSLLVLLDNCEHVLDGCAKLADALLRNCPGVALLATSREPLGIGGEHVYRVPSLAVPVDGADAGSTRSRAAASSKASGMPSSRRHIRPTTCAVGPSQASGTPCAAARSASSRTASLARIVPGSSPSAGVRMDGTRYTRSPSMPSGSRLVASSVMFGHRRSSASARLAQAPIRCSQLSSSTSRLRPPTASISVSSTGRSGSWRTPSTSATVTATRSGSPSRARSANHAPSPAPSASPAATCRARRVLPAPPAPVNVTSRQAPTSRRTSASSPSRPMKLDAGAGRLLRSVVSVATSARLLIELTPTTLARKPPISKTSGANILRPPPLAGDCQDR